MTPAKVTEIARGSAHRRQVAYVRASLLRGIEHQHERSRPPRERRH
jgi:hypothetical protein